jgi:hypothetical protein
VCRKARPPYSFRPNSSPRAGLKKNGPLGKTREVQSLLYSLNAEGSILEKVHPFREKL